MNMLKMTGPAVVPTFVASPRWMCEAVTAVMLVSVSVQSISVPRSTNAATPLPGEVLVDPSLRAIRLATYVLFVGAVVLDPQLVATAATPTTAIRPSATVLTVLRMKPPGGRTIEARTWPPSGKAAPANDRDGAASSTSGAAGGEAGQIGPLSREKRWPDGLNWTP